MNKKILGDLSEVWFQRSPTPPIVKAEDPNHRPGEEIRMVYLGVILAIALLGIMMFAIIRGHLHAIEEARRQYEAALLKVASNPADATARAACHETGRYYYRFLQVQEHAMFRDFPMPYFEMPEENDDRIAADIKEAEESHHHHAA